MKTAPSDPYPTQVQRRRLPLALCLALAFSPSPLIFVHIWGPRFALNLTESMPRGLYWRSPVKTLQRGNMVVACIPQKFAEYALHAGYLHDGPCVGGASSVLKYVAAISGDNIALTPQGVFVNGKRLPGSTPLHHDGQNRAIPHVPFGAYHLTSEETWLYSPKPLSFDSRYYGPINTTSVQASVRPVITEQQLPSFPRTHF